MMMAGDNGELRSSDLGTTQPAKTLDLELSAETAVDGRELAVIDIWKIRPRDSISRAGTSGSLLPSQYSGTRWTIASHHARATTLPFLSSESP